MHLKLNTAKMNLQNAEIFAENDLTITDQTLLRLNLQDDDASPFSNSETTRPKTLDFENISEPKMCFNESTPKVKTKKTPDKEIKKL